MKNISNILAKKRESEIEKERKRYEGKIKAFLFRSKKAKKKTEEGRDRKVLKEERNTERQKA